MWVLAVIAIACQPEPQNQEIASMNTQDPHSFSRPYEAVITHLNWQADVNFEDQTIQAVAIWDLKKQPNAKNLVLDVLKLEISEVRDGEGNPLEFTVGEPRSFLGSPLTITLNDNTNQVRVHYTTSPEAEALQWLNPDQTSGEQPFLFTQSQAILARSWVPVQDSPGIRFTYAADVTVPEGMLALMSAKNPTTLSSDGKYHFEMTQPIPAYLLALAVGDIVYQSISERTGVYAEPSVIKAAAFEFDEMDAMVEAAEGLYGPYQWEVYDLIILPPSFPFGGMENPRLTFATPTILAGDRSLTSLVAHELAHSWSGNLVTNATWDDFWLNEGFTVYFENRIMEEVYGRDYSEMLALLSLQDLKSEIKAMTAEGKSRDTYLKLDLIGRNPDEGMTSIAYDKGYYFLRYLEEQVGREKFDEFLSDYFANNAFKSMNTEDFIDYLNQNLFVKNDLEPDAELYQQWIYGPGLPANCPIPVSDRFAKVEEVVEAWKNGGAIAELIPQEDIFLKKWSSHEWLHFIRLLPKQMTQEQMSELDTHIGLTNTGNSEMLAAWMVHVIRNGYEPGYANLENFLVSAGRRKFLLPLYGEMVKTPEGKIMANEIYAKARKNYHYVSVASIDKMLNWEEENL